VAVGRLDWSQINKDGGEVRINDLGCQGEPMPRPQGGRAAVGGAKGVALEDAVGGGSRRRRSRPRKTTDSG
jgi:hypothetical protein